MKARSLRAAHLGATTATLFALLAGDTAQAHVGVRPGVVAAGESVRLLVEVPDVDGSAPTSVVLEGAGIETLSSEATTGAPDGESRWSVRARIEAPAGPLPIRIRIGYPGRGSVTTRSTLTVVPGESSGGIPWLAAIPASLLVLALGALYLSRRRA